MDNRFTQIFSNCDEQYVENTILYAKTDAAHLTMDEAGKQEVDKNTLLDIALKGMLIKLDGAYYVPTKIEETSGYLTVTCAADGTAKTFYSAEQE